jgi:hypothetical protein
VVSLVDIIRKEGHKYGRILEENMSSESSLFCANSPGFHSIAYYIFICHYALTVFP